MLLVLASGRSMGQDVRRVPTVDQELWTGIRAQQQVTKKIKVYGSYQYRLEDGFKTKSQSFYQVKARLRIWRWLYLTPGYRQVTRPDINRNVSRYTMDFRFRYQRKKSPLRLENRLRFQREKFINTSERSITLRNQVSASYNLSKRVDPGVSYELFFAEEKISDFRLRFNLRWRINKTYSIDTFYAYEQEMNRKIKDRVHVFGVIARVSGGERLNKRNS